jgi:hypothetical protein
VRGSHAPNFVDRVGLTYGHFTALAYVRRDHRRRAVWECRCGCGRPDCTGVVERNSLQLVRDKAGDCRHRAWNDHALKPRPQPSPAMMLLSEGVRAPWDRPRWVRTMRDAELLHAFAGTDLR